MSMHQIYSSKVCKKLPSLACFLTLIELKSALTILASVLTPLKQEITHLDMEKSAPSHPGKPLHPPSLTGNAHLGTTHFKEGASLSVIGILIEDEEKCVLYCALISPPPLSPVSVDSSQR